MKTMRNKEQYAKHRCEREQRIFREQKVVYCFFLEQKGYVGKRWEMRLLSKSGATHLLSAKARTFICHPR